MLRNLAYDIFTIGRTEEYYFGNSIINDEKRFLTSSVVKIESFDEVIDIYINKFISARHSIKEISKLKILIEVT